MHLSQVFLSQAICQVDMLVSRKLLYSHVALVSSTMSLLGACSYRRYAIIAAAAAKFIS